jgi:hypothetical protein
MKWFGESWEAPACAEDQHVETPVGMECAECAKPIKEDDQGFVLPYMLTETKAVPIVYHKVCFLRTIIPCEMWNHELLTDMPDYWVQHRKDKHGILNDTC